MADIFKRKTEYVYLQGKAKWVKCYTPDPWGFFKVTLYPNQESLDKFRALGVKTHIKKDEDGYYIVLRRPQQKMMRGKVVGFAPPSIVNKDGMPIRDVLIGNGSDVTVKLDYYQYKSPTGEEGKAVRLSGIRVDNLVPYAPATDMEIDDIKALGKVLEQPEQKEENW